MNTISLVRILNHTTTRKVNPNRLSRVFSKKFGANSFWRASFFFFLFKKKIIQKIEANDKFTETEADEYLIKNCNEENIVIFITKKCSRGISPSSEIRLRRFIYYLNKNYFQNQKISFKLESIGESNTQKLLSLSINKNGSQKIIWSEGLSYHPSSLFS